MTVCSDIAMDDEQSNWLVIVLLADAPRLLRMSKLHEKFMFESLTFRLVIDGVFHAFYDWIASPSGVIIGARYWALGDDIRKHCLSWLRLSYTKQMVHSNAFDIRFIIDLPESVPPRNDQCFGGDLIYKTGHGDVYALALDLYGLNQNDVVGELKIVDLLELKE